MRRSQCANRKGGGFTKLHEPIQSILFAAQYFAVPAFVRELNSSSSAEKKA